MPLLHDIAGMTDAEPDEGRTVRRSRLDAIKAVRVAGLSQRVAADVAGEVIL